MAGNTLVTAAVTDAREDVRGKVAGIFGRGEPDAQIERKFKTAIQLTYLAVASCFVLGLDLTDNPATVRRGSQVSVAGMVAAIVADDRARDPPRHHDRDGRGTSRGTHSRRNLGRRRGGSARD